MDNTATRIQVIEIKQCLEAEAEALKSGKIEDLAERAQQMDAQLEQLGAFGDVSLADLEEIKERISNNQQLLESAMDGIRFATNRLQLLQETKRRFDTYDQFGTRSMIRMNHESSLEKRA